MKCLTYALVIALLACSVTEVTAQGRRFRGGRGAQGGHGPGRGGPGRDKDFLVDRDDFHFLLEHHDQIRRKVKQLKDGVETVTESDNQEVAAKIQKHVSAMYQRVENRRPIRMRDPLFAEIFRHADKIKMRVENTPKGVRIIETSDDAYVVSLIQSHAQVVSAFVSDGFQEAQKTHAVPGKPDTGGSSMHSHDEIAADVYVEFDRVFIPALALTNQQKEPAARKALQRLSKAWDARFVEHYHGMFEGDSQWPRDLSRIAQCIALAEAKLAAGELLEAHEELEPIRDILMEARRRNHVDYPIDTLSQFHATMEAIVKPAMKLKPASLGDAQIAQWKQLAQRAEQEWTMVERAEFDLAVFGKSDVQQQQFPSMLRAEGAAIDRLQAALAGNDKEMIVKAARGLKPPFAKIYMFFGDFR
jgi:hypothetical protein